MARPRAFLSKSKRSINPITNIKRSRAIKERLVENRENRALDQMGIKTPAEKAVVKSGRKSPLVKRGLLRDYKKVVKGRKVAAKTIYGARKQITKINASAQSQIRSAKNNVYYARNKLQKTVRKAKK